MNSDRPQVDVLNKYLNLIFGWNKLIVCCVLVAMTAGLGLYLKTPKIYESSASLIYQQQRINPTEFSPDQQENIREMVANLSQQVLSRSSLESIIKDYDLYPEMRKQVPIEDVIEKMREKDIHVDLNSGEGNVFSVSFKGKDPKQAKRVAGTLASRFIEENLRMREERAKSTSSYIKDELRMAKKELEKKEARMRDYKMKYYNEMPSQQPANMQRLNALQEHLQGIQSNIQNLSQTRLLVSEQLERLEKEQPDSAATDSSSPDTGELDNLAAARQRLQELKTKYTSQYPAVKRLEKRIQALESEARQKGAEQNRADTKTADKQQVGENRAGNSRINEVAMQLKEIEFNLKSLREEKEEVKKQIKKYQGYIEAAPAREAEWTALTRDYDELKEYHDKLLSQSLSAEAAKSLEMQMQGSQFEVLDPAYLPNSPVKGTFLKFFLVAVGAGLAIGGGLVMGLDVMDTSFKNAREVEDYLQLPVSCALPLIVTEQEKRQKLIKGALWYGVFAVWFIAWGAATVYLWRVGEIIV